jgi:hypothetical protein
MIIGVFMICWGVSFYHILVGGIVLSITGNKMKMQIVYVSGIVLILIAFLIAIVLVFLTIFNRIEYIFYG